MTEANKQQYNLIQQYLNGTLDPKRMHDLEKEALEDPFLAEAIEGYAAFEGSVQPHLSLLQRQLEERITENAEKKNMFFFSWQRISVAAAASLLFISASILFWMKSTNTDSRIAGDPRKVEVNLSPDQDSGKQDQLLADQQSPLPETMVKSRSSASKGHPASRVEKASAKKNMNVPSTTLAKVEPVKERSNRAVPLEVLIASADNVPEEVNMRAMSGTANGKVVLRKASAFPAGDSEIMSLKAETAHASMPPVVAAEVMQGNVKPVVSWDKFNEYIDKSKRLPAPVKGEGSVTLQFSVDSLGKPGNFKVVKGIDDKYNVEAIRLIKDGPLWESGHIQETQVRVIFK